MEERKIVNKRVDGLQVHPRNLELYGPHDTDLADTMEELGLLNPIKVDQHDRILSGGRRWAAAKKLGWKTIPAIVYKVNGDGSAERIILLDNAYRTKTLFQRQKEADLYRDLVEKGEITAEELKERAREKGYTITDTDQIVSKVAPRAAGIDHTAYFHGKWVTDRDRGEREIDRAKTEGKVKAGQATALKKKLREVRKDYERDRLSATAAYRTVRQALRDAEEANIHKTEKDRLRVLTNSAVDDAVRKGEAFVGALVELRHTRHLPHLEARHALSLVRVLTSARDELEHLAQRAKIKMPREGRILEKVR